MFLLIKESIIIPFIYKPLKYIAYLILCILRVEKLGDVLNMIERDNCSSRVVFFKTIYINLRSIRFKDARKFPIFLYNKTQIISTKGEIIVDADKIYPGMIRWGRFDTFRSQGVTRINNKGTIIFKGDRQRIIRGNEICVFEKAILTIGPDCFFGENTMVYCQHQITIGKRISLTYHSQIFDTDFHYSMNLSSGEVARKFKPIVIGDYNWFGNKTTIKKGTKTPNHLTVAGSYSVLGKDYTKDIPEYSIIGGIPAKLIATGYSRLWNNEIPRIKELDAWFESHPEEKAFIYDLSTIALTDLTENEYK